jgi:hypothetical protein
MHYHFSAMHSRAHHADLAHSMLMQRVAEHLAQFVTVESVEFSRSFQKFLCPWAQVESLLCTN